MCSMRPRLVCAACLLILNAGTALGATVLFHPLDSLDGWDVRTLGAASVRVVSQSAARRCIEVAAEQGTAFLTRELPIDAVRGCRVSLRCTVKSEHLRPGPQACSTAKLHLAVRTPAGVRHYSARRAASADWRQEGVDADVPEDAQQARLNIGLEACSGRVLFSRLVVSNDQRAAHTLSLASVANATHEQLGLTAFPKGTLDWQGVPFALMGDPHREGTDCLRLRGLDHPDWPAHTASSIPVNTAASAIYILHAALAAAPMRETPCAIWTARFAGGHESSFSVFEGRQIGSMGQPKDLENWRIAWRATDPTGRALAFGVTKWNVYSTTPIVSLRCRAYRGAAPLVLAVTVLEEPPKRERATGEDDEEDYVVE